jgi:hypothetical protein
VIGGNRGIYVVIEFRETVFIVPDLPVGSVEDVRAIDMDIDVVDLFSLNIPGDMIALVDDGAGLSALLRLVCEGRAEKSRANDQIIIFLHTSCILIRFLIRIKAGSKQAPFLRAGHLPDESSDLLLSHLLEILLIAPVDFILVREIQISRGHSFRHGPLDSEIRIIPHDTTLVVRMIEIGHLVAELGFVGQADKAVREILRNHELLLVLCREEHSGPLAEGLRARAEVHSHIIDLAGNHADQLVLGIMDLEMQTAQDSLGGCRLIVLNEDIVHAIGLHIVLIIGLHEVASTVAENFRGNDVQSLNAVNILHNRNSH